MTDEGCRNCGLDHHEQDCPDGGLYDVEMSPEEELNDGPCMGEGCIHHDPMHTYAECYTVEMCEALEDEYRAAAIRQKEWKRPLRLIREIEKRVREFRRSTVRLFPEQRLQCAQEELRILYGVLEGLDI